MRAFRRTLNFLNRTINKEVMGLFVTYYKKTFPALQWVCISIYLQIWSFLVDSTSLLKCGNWIGHLHVSPSPTKKKKHMYWVIEYVKISLWLLIHNPTLILYRFYYIYFGIDKYKLTSPVDLKCLLSTNILYCFRNKVNMGPDKCKLTKAIA